MESSKRYNSVHVKIIARSLHLPPYFRALAIRWCYLNSSPVDPCCHGNEFLGQKLTITRPPWKTITLCLHLPPPSNTQQLGYYSVAMGLIPRSTERIFSLVNFQALENTAEGVSFGRGQRHSRWRLGDLIVTVFDALQYMLRRLWHNCRPSFVRPSVTDVFWLNVAR